MFFFVFLSFCYDDEEPYLEKSCKKKKKERGEGTGYNVTYPAHFGDMPVKRGAATGRGVL